MRRSGTTVQVNAADLDFLTRRGAQPHRGPTTRSRSSVLRRSLRCLRVLLDYGDPYASGRLPARLRPLIARSLADAWQLTPFEVESLHLLLARLPGFDGALSAAGLDVTATLDALSVLTIPEKWALVDLALQDQTASSAESATAQPLRPAP